MTGDEFVKGEYFKIDRNGFIFRILITVVAYAGLTFWLNAVRATSSLWFVWVLIVTQFVLYFLIFSISYGRAKAIGFKKFGIIPFIILAGLGRIVGLEVVIIPLLVITMIVLSSRRKNISAVKLPQH
jgi:hypothetical protein